MNWPRCAVVKRPRTLTKLHYPLLENTFFSEIIISQAVIKELVYAKQSFWKKLQVLKSPDQAWWCSLLYNQGDVDDHERWRKRTVANRAGVDITCHLELPATPPWPRAPDPATGFNAGRARNKLRLVLHCQSLLILPTLPLFNRQKLFQYWVKFENSATSERPYLHNWYSKGKHQIQHKISKPSFARIHQHCPKKLWHG